MKDRLDSIFKTCRDENRGALIVYVTCGCPDTAASESLIDQAVASGADIIELGVPFSDPMADGAVIQKASQIALAGGMNFRKVLELAGRVRAKHPETGLIVFSYFNVLLSYGLDAFGAKMAELDLDGVLSVDVPYEEREELESICRKYARHRIALVSPATGPDRMRLIAREASGFIYCVTVKGITGVRREVSRDALSTLQALKSIARGCPVAAGFGIASGAAAHHFADIADGVVSGSGIMRFMIDETMPIERRIEKAAELISELSSGELRQVACETRIQEKPQVPNHGNPSIVAGLRQG